MSRWISLSVFEPEAVSMKNNALAYSLKVWLTAVLLGSLILAVFIGYKPNAVDMSFTQQFTLLIMLTLVVSGVFSVPSLTVLLLSSWYLCNVSLTNLNRKRILTGVGVLSCLLAFFLAIKLHYLANSEFGLILPYFVICIASIWFYKLKTDREEPGNITISS